MSNKKSKLIYDCLESISKLYSQMQDFEQVRKFKQLQLDILSNEAGTNETRSVRQRKCKLWLELGGLYLTEDTQNQEKSGKYFEMVLEQAVKDKDLLLESLAVGNLGLCQQKEGNYLKAIDYFKVLLNCIYDFI